MKIILSEEKLKEIMKNGTPKDLEKHLEFEMGRALFTPEEEELKKMEGFPFMRAIELARYILRCKEEVVVLCGTEETKRQLEGTGLFGKVEIIVFPGCAEGEVYGMPKRVLEGKTILRDYIVKPSLLLDETCKYKALRATYGNLDLLTGTVIKEGE